MAYRFTPGDSPYIELDCGPLEGWAAYQTGAAWSCYALINRNTLGSWQGILTMTSLFDAMRFHFLEFNPSNQLTGDDGAAATWASAKSFASTADNVILGLSFNGTDNVANNAQFRWKEGASAWGSENETINLSQNVYAISDDDRLIIGNNVALSDDAAYDLIALGFTRSYLNQAAVESLTMASFATWEAVFSGANAMLYRFDDIDPLIEVNGNAGNEIERSAAGISLVADPAGFFDAGVDNPLDVVAPPFAVSFENLAPTLVLNDSLAVSPAPFDVTLIDPAPVVGLGNDLDLVVPAFDVNVEAGELWFVEHLEVEPVDVTVEMPVPTVDLEGPALGDQFPTTLISDFTSMPAGTERLFVGGATNLSVDSGRLANLSAGQWADGVFSLEYDESDVGFTFDVPVYTGDAVHIYFRVAQHGASATVRGYVGGYASGSFRLWRLDPGSQFTVLDDAVAPFAANDSIGVKAIGNELSVWHKPNGEDEFVQVVSATDSTYTDGGRFALEMQFEDTRVDNLRGGPLVAGEPATNLDVVAPVWDVTAEVLAPTISLPDVLMVSASAWSVPTSMITPSMPGFVQRWGDLVYPLTLALDDPRQTHLALNLPAQKFLVLADGTKYLILDDTETHLELEDTTTYLQLNEYTEEG